MGFMLQKSSYVNKPVPNPSSYRLVSKMSDAPYIDIIDKQVKKTLGDATANNAKLIELGLNLPYYLLKYRVGQSNVKV